MEEEIQDQVPNAFYLSLKNKHTKTLTILSIGEKYIKNSSLIFLESIIVLL